MVNRLVSHLRCSSFFCELSRSFRAGLIYGEPSALHFLGLQEEDVVAFGVVEDGPGLRVLAGFWFLVEDAFAAYGIDCGG